MGTDRLRCINYERMRNYRLNRAKAMLEKDGIDVLITWEPWNLRYIAACYVPMGYRWSCQQYAILPRNGTPHLYTYTCASTEALREEMPWLEGKVWAAPQGGKPLAHMAELEPFMKNALNIIAEYGLTGGKVGLDACPNFYLYRDAFVKAGFTVCDPAPTMNYARAIKNEDEVACVRYACRGADAAFSAIQRAIKPGIRECDIQAVGMEVLYDLGGDETMDFVVATGPRTDPLHIDFTDRIVRPGDFVVVDINGNSFQGYKSCYYRTFICGEANEEQKEVYEVARKMMYDGMAALKPGNTTWDVQDAWPNDPAFWGETNRKYLAGRALIHGIGLSTSFPMPFAPGQLPAAFNGQVQDFQLPVGEADVATALHIIDALWHIVRQPDYDRPTVSSLVAAQMHHYDHLFRLQTAQLFRAHRNEFIVRPQFPEHLFRQGIVASAVLAVLSGETRADQQLFLHPSMEASASS